MIPASLRSVRSRVSVLALLVAPFAIPVAGGAQAVPQPSPGASEAEFHATAVGRVAAGAVLASPIAASDPAAATAATATASATPPFASAAVAGLRTTAPVPADALARAGSVAPAALARRAGSGLQHSQVLMIVGGAAVLLGLVTDGAASDLLLIGGAGVGLYGLYRYLQ